MSAVLEVRDLAVAFGGVQALAGVTFALQDGELLGLIGPNGAGKTTAFKAITGLIRLDRGAVALHGQSLEGLSTARRVRLGLGLSHQIVRPFAAMTLLQNVALACGQAKTAAPWTALLQRDRRQEEARALALLNRVGIAQAAQSLPAAQPLGVLKRLEIARALALTPSVLLLDEPLAGLNHLEAAALADTIAAVNGEGRAVVLIEHNLGEVLRICRRLVVLDGGRVLAEGPPRQVMAQSAVQEAYLGRRERSDA